MASKRRRKKRERVQKPKDGLSTRERRFVSEFMACGNATEAYRRAGYSEKSADANAARLRVKESIRTAIAKAEQERWKRLQMTGDEALARLAHMGRSDMAEYVAWDADGNTTWTPSSELNEAQRAAIKSFKRTRKTIPTPNGEIEEIALELKLEDKFAPLKALGTAAGVLTDKSEMTLNVRSEESQHPLADKLAEARRRILQDGVVPSGGVCPGAGVTGDSADPGSPDASGD